jgi:hypothetical protein
MAYISQAKFTADYEAAKNANCSIYNIEASKTPAEFAWKLYNNTFKATLGFQIFGRWVLKENGNIKEFMGNIPRNSSGQLPRKMVGISDKEFENMLQASDTTSGSAFKIDADKWNVQVNDTWVLGGVNSLQEFYPASPVDKEYLFETHPDSKKYIVTCVGRELIGLALAGYREEASGHEAIGKIYRPSANTKTAENLSLVDYQDATSTIKEWKDAEAFYRGAGFTIG